MISLARSASVRPASVSRIPRPTRCTAFRPRVALDAEFHRLIGVASGNSVLASLIEGLSGPTNRARIWRGRTEVGAQERTVREHQAILDALAAHAPDVAHAAMVGHVAGVENWLRKAR
jgi:DNA-binding FadR family transcriptional regulator